MLSSADGQTANGSTNGSGPLQNSKERSSAHQPTPKSGLSASTYYGHDREEVTRLLIQALSDLGYHSAAENVITSSGYALENQSVSEFRRAILDGNWAEAEQLLLCAATVPAVSTESAGGPPGLAAVSALTAASSASSLLDIQTNHGTGSTTSLANPSGLVLNPGADRNMMLFGIRRQKYLELLEQREVTKALVVLRTELTPLYHDAHKLHFLPSLLMCQSVSELKAMADWDGTYGESRRVLLSALSRFISPSVMLPEHRLAVLLNQVKDYQVSDCLYHTSVGSPTLYMDHCCDRSTFPCEVLREIDGLSGEVWQVCFSHDGKRLASCGRGEHVVIWDALSFKMLFKLTGHVKGVGSVSWSPNDSLLVSCGRDGQARLWDARDGLLRHLFQTFEEPVSCCVWALDGQSIVLGSFDRQFGLCQWSLDGKLLFTWTRKHRTEDLVLSCNGQWLVAMDHEKMLHVYNYPTRELEHELKPPGRPVSVAISQDSVSLLVNVQNGDVFMYDLRVRGGPVRKYSGAMGGDCVLRSGYGGANESFVYSGSEDGKLNIWHKNTGIPVLRLDAHKPRCNAVSWSPIDPSLFVTCGDDNMIKIWSTSERVRQYEASHANGGGRPSNGW